MFKRLATPNTTTNKAISTTCTEFLTSAKLDLSPSYQRPHCWSQRQSNGLIDSIMHNWPLPLFTFYKLQAADPSYATGKRYECVDGQNRLCAIQAFRTGKPLLNNKGKEEWVTWVGQTADKKLRYVDLSEEEREWFDTYELTLTIIQAPMDLDSRKAMFTRLQDGSKISRSQYYKNKDHPVCQFISRTGLELTFWPVARGFLRAAGGEWHDTLVDCTTLYIHRADADPLKSLERVQSEVRKALDGKMFGPASVYNMQALSPVDDAALTPLMGQLITVLTRAKAEKVKCHKFHVSLLFLELLTGRATDSLTPAILRKWFKSHDKIVRDTKEGGAPQAYEVYCEQHKTLLAALAPPPPPAPVVILPHPPSAVRDATWTRYFGESEEGTCQCCEGPLKKTGPVSPWDLAHIDARSGGGSNEPENLVPTCVSCNRTCGTRNLKEWCESVHPSAPLLRRD
jgi:hypothetical protein